MVLIAAAVCNKTGKAIISRQFVELTKSRIEGLVAAFPKLMTAGKQHTFVETDSVRYVYQPLDSLYMLLITTKASNILEDLETLRLFSRVIPEYCRNMDEADILDNSFSLIFAFDEIVALGYRESVNLAQIRTFVEMDSHEEKVYNAVRQTQERDAKIKMREKAKELQRAKLETSRGQGAGGKKPGGMGSYGGQGGFSSSHSSESTPAEPPKPAYTAPSARKPTSSRAMKLGGSGKDDESFVKQLESEGVKVASVGAPVKAAGGLNKSSPAPSVPTEAVHVALEEKIMMTVGRDGGLQGLEVLGFLTLRVADESLGRIRLELQNTTNKAIQLQTHPNIDKELFKTRSVIGLKNPAKPFPVNTGVGVLKWRFTSSEDSDIPLSINCWPSDNGSGGCDVNIEYELENTELELQDVVMTIPVPHGVGAPNVAECDGDYTMDNRRSALLWQHPLIDSNNKSGSLEFSVGGSPDDFFPVTLAFNSSKSFSGIKVLDCVEVDSGAPVKHSTNTTFFAEKYEVV